MSERRRFPRLAAPLYASPGRMRRQQVLDASLGGIRIYSDDDYKENSPLELNLFLKDGTSLRCDARVAWTKKLPLGEPAHYEVGLAFTDISLNALELLKSVLITDDEGSWESP